MRIDTERGYDCGYCLLPKLKSILAKRVCFSDITTLFYCHCPVYFEFSSQRTNSVYTLYALHMFSSLKLLLIFYELTLLQHISFVERQIVLLLGWFIDVSKLTVITTLYRHQLDNNGICLYLENIRHEHI